MSEFTKVYSKWHAQNNRKYDSAIKYHKALMKNFEGWQPPKQLIEVPKFVADFIKNKKGDLKLYGAFHEIYKNMYGTDLYRWVSASNDRQEAFAKAWLDGYTVKKEKLFYLKNKNTGHILYRQPKEAGGNLIEVVATINEEYTWFTQDEIDTMHTGSYEKIEVDQ